MKNLFTILSLTVFLLVLLSCTNNDSKVNNIHAPEVSSDSTHSSETQIASLDSIVNFLLDASAKDFYDHQPPVPIGFRNVQIKYFEEKLYIICGEFLAKDEQNKEKWTAFATIKTSTSGYEQWIGAHASTYCQNSKVISYKISDLSATFKNRFDTLKKIGK